MPVFEVSDQWIIYKEAKSGERFGQLCPLQIVTKDSKLREKNTNTHSVKYIYSVTVLFSILKFFYLE